MFLPLCFTRHRVKLMARRHDVVNEDSGGLVDVAPGPIGSPDWRTLEPLPMGALVEIPEGAK